MAQFYWLSVRRATDCHLVSGEEEAERVMQAEKLVSKENKGWRSVFKVKIRKEGRFVQLWLLFIAFAGIFLWSYLCGTSSLKPGLCVLGIWVCLSRWDKGLTYKSQWQYQVKKSLQGLLALSAANTLPAFRGTKHKQEKAWLSTSPVGCFNDLCLSTTKRLFSWLSNLRIFLQVKFKISEIPADSLWLFP